MKRILCVLAFCATAASAAPAITGINPSQGFTFSTTHVTIQGSGFASGNVTCGFGVQCPISVAFGNGVSTVLTATPTAINLLVYPQPAGTVDVKVSVQGSGDATLPQGFAFSPTAIGSPEDYVRYLIPVVQQNLQGANGSLWTTEVKIRNRWAQTLPVVGVFCIPDPCSLREDIPPLTTVDRPPAPRGDGADGAFIYVPQSLNDPKPAITVRVRDLSKNATSFGTEIHTPQADEYQAAVDMIGIPTDPRYRATLRIYGSNEAPQTVRVRWYAEPEMALIQEQIVELSGIINIVFDPFPKNPAYAQLDPLPAKVRAAGDRVRVSVDYLGEVVSPPPPPIWAFVTVTDNVTQLTSTVTPSR